MSNEKTKVIFRKYKDNDEILALFPEEIGSKANLCSSYLHAGQHGDADPSFCTEKTVLATPKEYKSLLDELKTIGYDLVVCERYTQYMDRQRRKKNG